MALTDTDLAVETRSMQSFLTGVLWAATSEISRREGLLTQPVTVTIEEDNAGQLQPRFTVALASGITLQVRVDPAILGRDLVASWRDGLHAPNRSVCPGCGAELMTVGLPELAYAFRTCRCGQPEYDHVVEQLWHLACIREGRNLP